MSRLINTYELESGPPRLSEAQYVGQCNEQFRELLEKDPEENEIQDFLEQHPCLVPGHSTPGTPSGHWPLHCSLISQPRLLGQDWYVPDFMWIATHSGAWYPTLIEIEKPNKRIFNQDGTPSAAFTRARNQLSQWRSWFNDASNQLQFMDYFGVPGHFRRRKMQLHMILIYGRRSEFEDNPQLTSLRGHLLSGMDEQLVSFDRLTADPSITDAITAKATGHGTYRAINVPPTFSLGPSLVDRLLQIEGINAAIDNNPNISDCRKTFLKRRVPYWQRWASEPGPRGYRLGDRE